MIVGVLHPGEMGAAIGAALLGAGHEVLWASDGRSKATRTRAALFGDAGTAVELVAHSEVVFSVVPPSAAVELAESLPPFRGIYVDANAVSPATAARVGAAVERGRPRMNPLAVHNVCRYVNERCWCQAPRERCLAPLSAQRVCGNPRSTFDVAGSGQREVTTLPRV